MVQFEVEIRVFNEDDIQEQKIHELTKILESCGMKVLYCTHLKANADEFKSCRNKVKRPHNDNFFINIDFLLEDLHSKNEECAFKCLWMRWVETTSGCSNRYRPWLVMKNSLWFANLYQTTHKSVVLNFTVGTLYYPSSYSYQAYISDAFVYFIHDRRYIQLFGYQKDSCEYLQIDYSTIKNLLVSTVNGNVVVLFHLTQPPRAFERRQNPSTLVWHNKRKVDFCHITPDKIGKTNAVALTFHGNLQQVHDIVSRIHHKCGQLPVGYVSLQQTFVKRHFAVPTIKIECFDCLYVIQAIARKNYVLQYQGIDRLIKDVKQYHKEDPEVMHEVLTELFKLSEQDSLVDYRSKLKLLFCFRKQNKGAERNDSKEIVPPVTSLVRHAIITPTRILLRPPEIIKENRILRNFDVDYALRVTFRDDNYKSLNILDCDKYIYKQTIFSPLNKGIQIGSRWYEFLAWSNSQLRSHGVWMYAEDEKGQNVISIRKWMGDFSNVYTIPKRMSRMGQCFSHTQDVMEVPLEPKFVETVCDIEGGHDPESKKPYCFSDGIGKVSQNFASEICESLKLKPLHSAYQIRYAGYKGMLVLDPSLKNVDIEFRKSMLKFDCPQSHRLEIVKVSQPGFLHLNRPMINLMNQLGVDDYVFLEIQENHLKESIAMLMDGSTAANQLSLYTNITTVDFKELHESGIDLVTEPFFKMLLRTLHHHNIGKIKNKAQLSIEHSQGRNMFGVLDETGKLEYGQVFVQYSKFEGGKCTTETVIYSGPVLVTKNPCLSAGDLKKLEAVDIEELHHIVDCIVFPQKGKRPHPNEMGGSDLDGDEYSVIWQKDLIFPGGNCIPQQFPVPKHPKRYQCGKNLKMKDAINFFCDYVENDKVGVIASAHLALSDSKKVGIFDKDCTHIARLFSIAVDFAKNGQAVNLDPELRAKAYPDYMQNRGKQCYKSKRALGKLYRKARDFDQVSHQATTKCKNAHVVDPLLEVQDWEIFKDDALRSRKKYTQYLLSLMQTYGIENESEIITGAFSKLHYRHAEKKDQAEIEQLLALCVKHLWQYMTKELMHGMNVNDHPDAIFKKASAWYMVTYADQNAEILSFPWVASYYLAVIKKSRLCKMSLWPCTVNSCINKLEADLTANLCSLEDLNADMKNLIVNYDIEAIETVVKVLLSWGKSEKLLKSHRIKGHMVDSDIIKLFSWFIDRDSSLLNLTPICLLIEFLKFCMSFRLKSKGNTEKKLPVPFAYRHYKNLGRHAVFAYHHIAITGTLEILGIEPGPITESVREMEPIFIDTSGLKLQQVWRFLMDWSDVDRVEMRKDNDGEGYWVSSIGTPFTIGSLESILQKGSSWLAKAIKGHWRK